MLETAQPDGREQTPEVLAALEGIGVRFGRLTVLEDVGLSVRSGEIVTLIGPNGAGKTTLVHVLLGLMSPHEGWVHVKPGTRIGYLPQHAVVDETLPLTVRRFLTLGGNGRVDTETVLAEVGVGHLAEIPLPRISGGEFRRVLLARALSREPDLLVLDEPAQGVDVTGQAELFRLISRMRETRGCGVLLVSHDLHLVMAATDHVVCLNHHVCCSGRPETVSRHPAFLALFGPSAAQAFAFYTHQHDHGHDMAGGVVPLDARGNGPESGERDDG